MTPEQSLDKISNNIVNTLILYKKIEMGYKNVWLDGIKELLVVAGDKYTHNAHEKLIESCKSNVSFDSAFHTFENIFKKSITPSVPRLEEKQKTINELFMKFNHTEKIETVIGWLKFAAPPLPKCYLDWVKQQDEETKVKIRKYYKTKDNHDKTR